MYYEDHHFDTCQNDGFFVLVSSFCRILKVLESPGTKKTPDAIDRESFMDKMGLI